MNIIYLLIPLCCGFVLKPKLLQVNYTVNYPIWGCIKSHIERNARNWFIKGPKIKE